MSVLHVTPVIKPERTGPSASSLLPLPSLETRTGDLKMASKSNYALRLPASLKAEAERMLQRTARRSISSSTWPSPRRSYFAERGARAAVPRALKLLRMAGRKEPLLEGDEVE